MNWLANGPKRIPQGHLVPAGATVPALRCSDEEATLQVGHGAVIEGPLSHAGGIILGRNAQVRGSIHARREIVVGAGSQVGELHSEGRIVVQAHAQSGAIHAGGDVILLGTCAVGDVYAGGDIIVVGSPQTGTLAPGGRIATRPY